MDDRKLNPSHTNQVISSPPKEGHKNNECLILPIWQRLMGFVYLNPTLHQSCGVQSLAQWIIPEISTAILVHDISKVKVNPSFYPHPKI